MTPLQIAQDNLTKLERDTRIAQDTVAEYQSRLVVLAAQIESTRHFIAAHTPPAEPVPAPQAVS